jgi:hypothetical protein
MFCINENHPQYLESFSFFLSLKKLEKDLILNLVLYLE